MDNVAIGTNNSLAGLQLYKQILHEFLSILEQHLYFFKVSKCEFEKNEIEFLKFCIGKGTVHIDLSKIGGIANWPRDLKFVKEVWQILRVLI